MQIHLPFILSHGTPAVMGRGNLDATQTCKISLQYTRESDYFSPRAEFNQQGKAYQSAREPLVSYLFYSSFCHIHIIHYNCH